MLLVPTSWIRDPGCRGARGIGLEKFVVVDIAGSCWDMRHQTATFRMSKSILDVPASLARKKTATVRARLRRNYTLGSRERAQT
jgi:hypothetical protein